ncbi:putative damage-inducible protein DinB [Planomicrobium stackebrandtii]|uniref:Damage-inducible protein DinB n=1 Tax=Planomicrobium stackebrandtii TaxID=253160 RepID=A0ABU0GZA2_9BACL|nr:DinB family protein [Planomicrobium stackebrandtii]MDQ0430131.1 putative damage-inducible protein DinB [Planomicrobium stackebrandtii]
MFKEDNAKIRNQILQAVEGMTDEKLNQKPSEEEWSAIQILDHLQLMEKTIAKGVSHELTKETSEKALKKPIALTVSRSFKVDAPKHVIPTDEFVTLEEMKERLNASHNLLYEAYGKATPEQLEQKSMAHPVFGKVPLIQWFPFVGLHEKRHFKQLEKTLSKLD